MNEEHFKDRVVHIEQQPFVELEPYQISSCHFCFRLLKREETKMLTLKDRTIQTVCKKCEALYWLRIMFANVVSSKTKKDTR